MKKLIKMFMVVVGVSAMLNFAGCGENSATTTQNATTSQAITSTDSAKDVAMKKLKDAGFDKVEFVSEKITGDQSVIVAKITSFGETEETRVYCSKASGTWTVTKLD